MAASEGWYSENLPKFISLACNFKEFAQIFRSTLKAWFLAAIECVYLSEPLS